MATKRSMKGWDSRIQEAAREPIVLEIGGKEIHVHPLLGSDVRELMKAQQEGDHEGQMRVIFGDDADHVQAAFDEAPFAAGQSLMEDILVEFGVISGNR